VNSALTGCNKSTQLFRAIASLSYPIVIKLRCERRCVSTVKNFVAYCSWAMMDCEKPQGDHCSARWQWHKFNIFHSCGPLNVQRPVSSVSANKVWRVTGEQGPHLYRDDLALPFCSMTNTCCQLASSLLKVEQIVARIVRVKSSQSFCADLLKDFMSTKSAYLDCWLATPVMLYPLPRFFKAE
jgi:hypothetical protein